MSAAAPLWRVRDRSTWELLRTSRHRARSGRVAVTRADVADVDRPMVAFAVGRKVGSAVVRNRLRRQLRDEARRVGLPSGAYLVQVRAGSDDPRPAFRRAVAELTGVPA